MRLLKSPIFATWMGRCGGLMLWMLFKTLRKEVWSAEGCNPYQKDREGRFIYAAWHDSSIMAAFGGRHHQMVALTSRHRDGSFVEGVVGFVGVASVRGSTGKGGSAATLQLIHRTKDQDIVITPDGPRGPRRMLSRGVIYLASRTGKPIVPTAFLCDKAWEIPGSWTTQMVPKPFSRVVLVAGAPITIPNDLSTDDMEPYRIAAQRAMDRLHERAGEWYQRLVSHDAAGSVAIPQPQVDSADSEKRVLVFPEGRKQVREIAS